MKKVLLLVVDALTARLLESLMEEGKFPHLQQLSKAGRWQESVSIFPSITHAALTTIVTGKYPKDHGILGSYWYQTESDEVVYMGADPEVIWNNGVKDFYREILIGLNHHRLQSPTLFQELESQGLHATCLNQFVFHGNQTHQVNAPLILQLTPGVADNDELTVLGPTALYLGEFVNDTAVGGEETSFLHTGPQNWYGFKDSSVRELLVRLAEKDALQHFTLAYFPENDFLSHEKGPEAAHRELGHFDAMLGQLFDVYGGLEAMLSEFAIIITGDHAQSNIKESDAAIDLAQILAPWQCATAGKAWQDGDEIMVCANLRAANLYFRRPEPKMVQEAAKKLRRVPAIDQVICRAGWLGAQEDGYQVLSERGDLHFWRGGNVHDAHGNVWGYDGDLAAVDGRLDGDLLQFEAYPNALERLAGVLDSEESGQLWATAVPGHEFSIPGVRVHNGGGSHGSLHRSDSLSPFITAGMPDHVGLPSEPRLVDVATICLDLLSTD